jgi:pectate lyase
VKKLVSKNVFNFLLVLLLAVAAFLNIRVGAQSLLAAFPGAQGGGAASVGGRGGRVIEVTNLNSSGTGSLRNCVEASGARTCIFKVAGIITPGGNDLLVTNPFLTIAGQTAPGEVILGGPNTVGSALRISTHDVIVRYITFSPDNVNTPSGPSSGTVAYSIINTQNYNNICDHCTSRWAGNKEDAIYAGFSGEYNAEDGWQWSILYEPHQGHPVGPSISENDNVANTRASHDVDFHHDLFVNVDHRIPEYNHSPARWDDNITYNFSGYGLQVLGATQSDVINNIWACNNMCPGSTFSGPHPIHSSDGNWPGSLPGTPSVYVAGNIGIGHSTPNSDQYGDLARQVDGEPGNEIGAFPSNWKRSSPLPSSNGFPITLDAAVNLWALLKPTVGNSRHLDAHGAWVGHRDAADTRIVNQYDTHGTGGFWPNGMTCAGSCGPLPPVQTPWTDIPITGFAVCTSSLHDGICDQWKTDHNLSLTDTGLAARTSPTGYTYLENFLNGAGNAAPPPPSGRPVAPTNVVATPH